MNNKHIKKELINQVSKWTGRKPYPHELIIAWYQMRNIPKEELLRVLVEINEMLHTRNIVRHMMQETDFCPDSSAG